MHADENRKAMAETTIKVYDGDTLIADATLCRKTDTGEVGWYDYVSEMFYPTLIERNEVGTQYIDTGFNPAVDAVPVVRCKECKHGEIDDPDFPRQHYCKQGCGWNDADFFCAYAEGREGNAAD